MSSPLLSAEELMKYFNRVFELPDRGGAKDYAPDNSWLQGKQLEHFYEERNEVLVEERVKKKGHLVCGEWKSDLGKVQLTDKIGKFWQTVGHVDNGNFLLFPEEALSLLDKGDLEIYYDGLPLSLQEAYSTLLRSTIPIEHYQVYSHLSRLGYIIFRHTPIETTTKYEAALGLTSAAKKRKKRKANAKQNKVAKVSGVDASSPHDPPSNNDTPSCQRSLNPQVLLEDSQEHPVVSENVVHPTTHMTHESRDDMDMHVYILNEPVPHEDRRSSSHQTYEDQPEPGYSQDGSDHSLTSQLSTFHQFVGYYFDSSTESQLSPQLSDFSLISVPAVTDIILPGPENLPVETLHQSSTKSDFDILLEADNKENTRSKNWSEFKAHKRSMNEQEILESSPAACLWRGRVQPLLKPSEAICTASVLDKLKIISNMNLVENGDKEKRLQSSEVNLVYDVYQPNTRFSKIDRGIPAFRLAIVSQDDPFPSMADIVMVGNQSVDGAVVQWAVVDHGDVSFYSFHGMDLPRDIPMP